MASLTDLGVAAIRDGFRNGDFSAREVAQAFNSAVAKAKAVRDHGRHRLDAGDVDFLQLLDPA